MKEDKKINIKTAKGHGFSITPVRVYEDERLTAYDKLAYGVLRSFGETCYASYTTIGKRMGCSSRQAIRASNKLLEYGYITKALKDGFKTITVYDYPMTESHTPMTGSHLPYDWESHKTDKLNRESKQIPENLKKVVEEAYSKYPSKRSNGSSTGKSLKHKEKLLRILSKEPEYPILRAIQYHIKSMDGFYWGLDRFLNNLPDPADFKAQAPTMTEEGACQHEIDWEGKLHDLGFNQYKGACKHCGAGIIRTKEE